MKTFGSNENTQRVYTERRIVRGLIKHLAANGWQAKWVYDGGEQVPVTTQKHALEVVTSVDESTITFRKDGKTCGVFIVLGNHFDVISDYSFTPDFGALMTAYGDKVNAMAYAS